MSLSSLAVFLGLLSYSAAARTLKATTRTPSTQTFFPPNSFQTFEGGVDHPLSRREDASLADSATAYVQAQLQVNSSAVTFKSGYASDIVQYAYVKQQHNNIPFVNSVANVAFKDGKVVSFGHSFSKPTSIASSTPSISIDAAVAAAEKALNGKYNNIPATLEYLVNSDNTASLVHVVQIRNKQNRVWVEAFVDAHSGQLLSTIDLVADAVYRVLPIYKEDLTEGFETLTDPQDLTASPLGWHNDGTTSFTNTTGNNVVAFYNDLESATTNQSAPGLVFNYTQDLNLEPAQGMNIDASVTNVFYIINTIHDVSYRYGFTEAAFNFQQTNIQSGGIAGDPVLAFVQLDEGFDNSAFTTPPDGQSGEMALLLWDQTIPMRDSGLENDIVTHENTHGITNRMTGGGTGRCLQIAESGGLGEGWSDSMADWMEQTGPTIVDFYLGTYVDGGVPVRSRPYSTNSTINPYTYSSLLDSGTVHGLGEVWANMLHNVLAALVGAHGFSKTARTDPSGTEGNVVFLHLFIDALALQPCQPDFLQARDAIIQADQNRYAGANKCVLWTAFASRGLGFKAFDYTDDFTVPSGC
ncbi:Fungalysin metallopeptidase-domain-containing protein [Mycena alexandri]|uniref:Extracellular metalloproteinase n=1 Tax=Mycena alexandri TaxID=1745969 RepID=A0AAD6T897_9AGAR|nr:Fungalysin metallopeptidase-domain-containing protein [Mycena alexandri]